METQVKKNKNSSLHSYIIKQGLRLNTLSKLLHTNTSALKTHKRCSILCEIGLYCLVITTIAFAIYIPTNVISYFPIGKSFGFNMGFKNESLMQTLFWTKVILVILSFTLIGFAVLIRNNRKKSNIIYKAFIETDYTQYSFYKALDEIKINEREQL
jgi:hypothetical protein